MQSALISLRYHTDFQDLAGIQLTHPTTNTMCENLFAAIRERGHEGLIDLCDIYRPAFPGRPSFCDDEFDIDQSKIENWIHNFSEEFKTLSGQLHHKIVDECSTWEKDGKMVMFLIYENDDDDYAWGFGLHLPKHFVCVGNVGFHPFVETNKFSFSNTDGSTLEEDWPCQGVVDADKVVDFMFEKIIEFLYNQEH